MKKRIRSTVSVKAAETEVDKLEETVSELKDDFDYILSGFDKLDRTGAQEHQDALVIAESLQATFADIISQIAEKVAE